MTPYSTIPRPPKTGQLISVEEVRLALYALVVKFESWKEEHIRARKCSSAGCLVCAGYDSKVFGVKCALRCFGARPR